MQKKVKTINVAVQDLNRSKRYTSHKPPKVRVYAIQ